MACSFNTSIDQQGTEGASRLEHKPLNSPNWSYSECVEQQHSSLKNVWPSTTFGGLVFENFIIRFLRTLFKYGVNIAQAQT